ncbi:MAG: diphosphomevalonate decarboxylase [Candidatus Levybacteria bacterium RIFCSPLOWO2_02_FULL_37_10]|nr:MAG: diphosphomevalonate decarboxylase [Candidatus Levybacteria bacterium RIFCSPHIGHO2_01_FULL_37_33]OGH15767.1 MAG: diphosphomevalonate decarboxylase [Candidatus Levybacteria bacterium RIFCSPHIGHO2_02_FULL_37_11]OGH29655.1 MAG: diphosphomevalonate decarboxylase [Candidatus Levybacteria bacterium RIFCSPHIGHO2_12_FULL_37_12]OGH32581.1 MAG: diphosphomevalonate decarboxylase [Candidatus Levybacteria bacterium RIFCSPLOWO2_01_FULL_36_54]OGH43197.1 MAG: diphosphomevalonate decarboxylase [Candidatu
MKTTAITPSNIAFIKYWGKKDEALRLPENGSISMNLSNLLTTTTVEFSSQYKEDSVIINGVQEPNEGSRAIKHLDRIRKLANISDKAKVVTENNFPTGTGLSSSASGFAALTVAGAKAAGLNLSEKDLSILARQGSGSACRSIPDGFVEWIDGDTNETSYAISVYPENYWDIVDVVAVVSKDKKHVGSTQGHKLATTSPFFEKRLELINDKIKLVKKYLKERDFEKFGELIEEEALELHAIYLTSKPSLIYLLPGTLLVMHMVKKWREDGLPVYFTLNTGQDMHLICERKNASKVSALAEKINEVQKTIINFPSEGARIVSKSLF